MADHEFYLKLDGTPFYGWETMALRRSLERMAGEFSVTLSLKPDEPYIKGKIVEGTICEVLIDDSTVLRGYIDTISQTYDDSTSTITINGRDAVGDLIDCAATVDGPHEYNNQKLNQIVGKILSPYNIPVKYLSDVGAAFPRIAIEPGESAFDLLERCCRYRSLLPISDGLGGLLIMSPKQAVRSPGKIVYGDNVLSGSLDINGRDRFSLYVVKAQQEGTDDLDAESVAGAEGRARDELVKRYRPKVIVAEMTGYDLTLAERAEWEKKFARARAIRAGYKVRGWAADNKGTLWQIGTIVPVQDSARGISRDMLIVSLAYSRGGQGTVTELSLALPEAYDLPAEKTPENEDVLGDL